MKYTIPAAATAVLLLLAAPAFAQGAMGNANGAVAGKTDGAMSPGTAMSGKAMASGKMTRKKKKAAADMSGAMSGSAASRTMPAGTSAGMSGTSR